MFEVKFKDGSKKIYVTKQGADHAMQFLGGVEVFDFRTGRREGGFTHSLRTLTEAIEAASPMRSSTKSPGWSIFGEDKDDGSGWPLSSKKGGGFWE